MLHKYVRTVGKWDPAKLHGKWQIPTTSWPHCMACHGISIIALIRLKYSAWVIKWLKICIFVTICHVEYCCCCCFCIFLGSFANTKHQHRHYCLHPFWRNTSSIVINILNKQWDSISSLTDMKNYFKDAKREEERKREKGGLVVQCDHVIPFSIAKTQNGEKMGLLQLRESPIELHKEGFGR